MANQHEDFGLRLRTVGGALFGRVWRITRDEARASEAARSLFVRLLVHARAHLGDERARWAWIYRAGTNRGLQLLPPSASPGGQAPGAPARAPLPTMSILRGFDEATQNAVVLSELDGLSVDEIAEVLRQPAANIRRKLAEWRAAEQQRTGAVSRPETNGGPHPSVFALARDRAAHATHLEGCAVCRAVLDEVEAAGARFTSSLDAATEQRLLRQVNAEVKALSSGIRWKRILFMTGSLVVITVLAFAVTKPREPRPGELPFSGGTASRAKKAGLQISVRRGTDVGAFVPGATSRLGDRLHFRVRTDGPRYFGLRVRGPAKQQLRLYPAEGEQAVLVKPGQALDRDYILEPPLAAPGRTLYVEGFFAERPFVLDGMPHPDIELVPVRLDIEP